MLRFGQSSGQDKVFFQLRYEPASVGTEILKEWISFILKEDDSKSLSPSLELFTPRLVVQRDMAANPFSILMAKT